jgi:hypothetical protein
LVITIPITVFSLLFAWKSRQNTTGDKNFRKTMEMIKKEPNIWQFIYYIFFLLTIVYSLYLIRIPNPGNYQIDLCFGATFICLIGVIVAAFGFKLRVAEMLRLWKTKNAGRAERGRERHVVTRQGKVKK